MEAFDDLRNAFRQMKIVDEIQRDSLALPLVCQINIVHHLLLLESETDRSGYGNSQEAQQFSQILGEIQQWARDNRTSRIEQYLLPCIDKRLAIARVAVTESIEAVLGYIEIENK